MLRLRLDISFWMISAVLLTPVLIEVLVWGSNEGVVVSEPLASLLAADAPLLAADVPLLAADVPLGDADVPLGVADSVELTTVSLPLVCSTLNTTDNVH